MKQEFDFVKFVLILAGIMVLAVLGWAVWAVFALEDVEGEYKSVQQDLATIGELSGRVGLLEKEESQDQLGDEDLPYSYFQKQAQAAGINANTDYEPTPRDEELNVGYKDQEFTLTFKPDRLMSRQRLGHFMWYAENGSKRIKLVKAKLTLDTKAAEQDRWRAVLTFLRRDPYAGPAR
jgi:hypothetical protein